MVIKVTGARDADQSSGSVDNEPDRKAVLREREISDGGKRRRRRDGVKEEDRESWRARWRTVEECMQEVMGKKDRKKEEWEMGNGVFNKANNSDVY